MKRSVSWHAECLINWQASLDKEAAEVARVQKQLDERVAEMQFYRSQITRAIKEGRTDFDRERYGVKRGS